MRSGLLIGVGAGLVSALVLVAAAKGGTVFALFALVFLAPLPIIIAGLGWGWQSALLAALFAGGALGIAVQPKAAAMHMAAIGLPMAVFSYFLMLNRVSATGPDQQQPAIEWYPLGRILGLSALIAGGLATVALLSIANDVEGLQTEVRKVVDKIVAGQIPFPGREGRGPTESELDAFAKVMTQSFGAAIATFWMALACLNMWLGGLIAQASGRLGRPWPDLSRLTLPRETPLAFVLSIALSFLSGYPGLIASGFASAFFFAYLIVGLAILHNITRGLGARMMILVAVYLALVFFNPFSGIIVALIGIAEPISPLRRSQSSSPGG
ncbi:MAG: DUF2232 domain-containing protein [Hyphomicrobiaceae bacterium]